MADDVAKQIRARLDKPFGTGKDAGTFYVNKSEANTPFSEGLPMTLSLPPMIIRSELEKTYLRC